MKKQGGLGFVVVWFWHRNVCKQEYLICVCKLLIVSFLQVLFVWGARGCLFQSPFLSFPILFFEKMFFTFVVFAFASSLIIVFDRFGWYNERFCFANFAVFCSVSDKKVWFLRSSLRNEFPSPDSQFKPKPLCSTLKQIIDYKANNNNNNNKKESFWVLGTAMTQTPASAPQSQTKETLQTPVTASGDKCYLLNVYFPTVSIRRFCSQRSNLLFWNGGDFY